MVHSTMSAHHVARRSRRSAAGLLLGLLAACSIDGLVGNAPVPSDVADPAITRTSAGAQSAYRGTLLLFRRALSSDAEIGGVFTDELQSAHVGQPVGLSSLGAIDYEDSRILPEYAQPELEPISGVNGTTDYRGAYSRLNQARGAALDALGLLHEYVSGGALVLRGHLYALMGYSEVMLAELFCSGIPLSTLDYDGDYTLAPG